jgi:Mg2+-importing ATPase
MRTQQSQPPATPPWWLSAPPHSKTGTGLSTEQAGLRLEQYGPNRFIARRESPLWLKYLAHFRNPLVLILLLASTLSALLDELMNFIIISAIVFASVTLDFLQEHRAHNAAEKLRQSIALRASVLRDGVAQLLPIAQIVPGDIVLLKAGDMVPADGLVLEARDCFVNQSLLTGESYPVEKTTDLPVGVDEMQAATNAVFMGSSVVSGSARVRIMRTGSSTDMGAIAERIAGPEELTSFDIGTRRFNGLILRLTTLMVLFVLMVNLLSHKPWLESFLFAVALAVGLTPELLPMVVSVTLARGAVRMARENVIVKRQSAIQDLGSMDVLCTDKTGTLTEATIRVAAHVDPLGTDDIRIMQLAYLNSWFESGLRNPMDEAILAQPEIDISGWEKIDEVPFDFERRRVSVLLQKEGQRSLVVKGAPDEIIRLCTHYGSGDAMTDLDAAALERIRSTYHALEDQGMRVLAIAHKPVAADHPHAVVGDEVVLVLAGFAAFLDPPKTSAGDALRALTKLGVQIKVLTGDSERVTRHIYQVLGLPIEGVVLGTEIDPLDDFALQAKIKRANLFCRLNPSQKSRVIAALRASGHVVGYLGDGVNDAPSLHAADVGLSVDSAVDVAKAAADMILLKQDLNVLHIAVLEGRRTFGNIMKYIMMSTSSNFGNMFSMAAASVFLPFLPMKPVQILLNNILYDLSEIAIPLDAVDANELKRPHVLDIRLIRNFMWTVGPVSSLFDLLTFGLLLWLFEANEALFQTGWFIESMCTQVLVIFVIRTRGNPLKSHPHPLLIATSLAVVLLAMILPFTELGAYFGLVPPPASFFAVLALLVLSYLLGVEFIKRQFYRHHRARSHGHAHRH